MSPVARRCGGCGGPLPEAPDDRRTITCSFCGMVNEVSATAPQPIIITLDTRQHVARAGRSLVLAILVGVAVMATGIGVVVFRALRPVSGALDAVRNEALRARELSRPLALTELPTLTERGHRQAQRAPVERSSAARARQSAAPRPAHARTPGRAIPQSSALHGIPDLLRSYGMDLAFPKPVAARGRSARPRARRGRLPVAMTSRSMARRGPCLIE